MQNRSATHFAIVQSIYEAFGRGDVAAIVAHMSPDVDWEYAFSDLPVPWLQRRRGPEGVAAFFASLAEGLRIDSFRPTEMLAGADKVVVLIDIAGVGVHTGVALSEQDEVHIWHFDAQDKVCRFRHVLDTWQHHRAWRGA